jgi:uncharacterized membrane protein (DUF485 family)
MRQPYLQGEPPREGMELMEDPEFVRLLRRRSRLRWGLSGLLTAAYLAYGIGGLYVPGVFASRLGASGISLGFVLGYGIIFLGIACSIFYVWQVNRIVAPLQNRLPGKRG